MSNDSVSQKSEINFVNMTEVQPEINALHSSGETLISTQKKNTGLLLPLPPTPTDTEQQLTLRQTSSYVPPNCCIAMTARKSNIEKLTVSFSTDLEEHQYQTSFDYPSAREHSFDTYSNSTASTNQAGDGCHLEDKDMERQDSPHRKHSNSTIGSNPGGEQTDDSQQPSRSPSPLESPHSSSPFRLSLQESPRRIRSKYREVMEKIRQRQQYHRNALLEKHGSNLNGCTAFLLVVGLATLALVVASLAPHWKEGANSQEQVYYDATQDKKFVVRNQDSQWTLMILALLLMLVLLLGSVYYFFSVALDETSDNDDDDDDTTEDDDDGDDFCNKPEKKEDGEITLSDHNSDATEASEDKYATSNDGTKEEGDGVMV